jgi:uncharacterized DUF497 family protein
VVLFTDIEFAWDARKAQANALKHGIPFSLSTTTFRDSLALTIYDAEHSADEERWATIGKAQNGQYLVVVHTCDQSQPNITRVRIISARAADKGEIRAYATTPWQIREEQFMRDHYDFSKGVRGKFYQSDAKFHLPVYLDQEVELQLAARAEAKGVELSELVNELLRKELANGTD